MIFDKINVKNVLYEILNSTIIVILQTVRTKLKGNRNFKKESRVFQIYISTFLSKLSPTHETDTIK